MVEIRKVQIDLSELYVLTPMARAAETLSDILASYEHAEIVALVNISPDVGLEILEDYQGIAERVFKEEEDDLVAEQKVAEELVKELQKDIVIVELLDGYEVGIAFVVGEVG